MTAQVVLRLIDKFFRHLWLYLVPIVLVGAVGVWTAMSGEKTFQSVGTLKIERGAAVAEVTGSEQDPGFGWETPAGATSQSMGALLRTQTFVDDVATAAGLEDMIDAGTLTLDEVRASIGVYPDGARLVKVVGTNARPDVANQLAVGAIESYIESVQENESSDANVAIAFLRSKLPEYEAEVATAQTELETWLAEHPDPDAGETRPSDQQVELDRLQETVRLREERLTEVQTDIEQQELSVEQKEAEVRQRIEVIDPPQEPFAPQPTAKKAVLTVAMALVLGSLLSLFAVVIATILDRSILFPGDVKERLDRRVLAVVPKARVTATMRKKLESLDDEPRAVELSSTDPDVITPVPGPADGPVTVTALDGDSTVDDADDENAVGEPDDAPRPLGGARLKRVN